ncbi:MAG: MAPEG family protein [Candidatus Azotimanducaceae bacterium WSBS_2022_MAG_OTU7]
MDLGLVHMPLYAALTTAFLTVMQVVLMFRVIGMRGQADVLFGTGGNETLEKRQRVHGNFIENVPTFLVALALIELIAGSTVLVAVLAGVFMVSRIAHAIGLGMSSGLTLGRLVGTLGTMISMVVAAGYLAYLVYLVVDKL